MWEVIAHKLNLSSIGGVTTMIATRGTLAPLRLGNLYGSLVVVNHGPAEIFATVIQGDKLPLLANSLNIEADKSGSAICRHICSKVK